MFCKNCGHHIDDWATFCPNCGTPNQVMPMYYQEPKKPINGIGVAGFVVSLLSLWLGAYFCIASIVGLILSIVAVSSMNKHSLNGLAIAGLVLGILSLLFWGMIWLIVGRVLFGLLV